MVKVDLHNNNLIGDNWSPTASKRTFRYLLADTIKNKAIVQKLYSIGEFLQENFINRVFVKLDSRYAAYFPEYSSHFRGPLILLKSLYVMTNYGKLFANELKK